MKGWGVGVSFLYVLDFKALAYVSLIRRHVRGCIWDLHYWFCLVCMALERSRYSGKALCMCREHGWTVLSVRLAKIRCI